MLVIQLASLFTFAAASASAITIPSYKQTNAQRLRRGLKPLAPTRVYDSARKRQDPVPSNGPVTNLTPHDIQGNGFLSPYVKQTVTGLQGVVTAKASNGFYIQSVIPDTDDSTSEGLFVFGTQSVGLVNVGDIISVDGIVDEYAPNTTAGAAGLRLTELTFPTNVKIISSGNTVTPLVLGVDRTPSTSTIYFEDPWQLPSKTVNIEETGQKLDPAKRGLDFWESLEGMLVTVPVPRAVARGRSKAFWAVGSAYATNSGARGGLNLGKVNGLWDTNPEAIYIQAPLSGTGPADETINIGSTFQDITGVISYANGQPVLYPIAPPVLTNSRPAKSDYPRSMILGDDQCKVTVGNYNVLNLNPKSATFAQLGDHVANFMNLPYALALEEIQDNSGATDDGITSGSETLRLLVEAIYAASGNTVRYEILEIPPINNEDGGAPGGNIHPAVLYRSDKLELDTFQAGAKGGNADSQTLIKDTTTGETTFALNPALIDPTNSAWTSSRKPLTASFIVKGSTSQRKRIHLIAAHLASKSGSTTTAGREQTYENGAVEARIEQAKVIRDFIKELLAQDPNAHLVLAGDLNEFSGVQPLEVLGEVLTELVVPNPAERYSYQFDQNTQQIDHILTVPKLSTSSQFEILHVNTWGTLKNQASDHDPVLSSFSVC